MCVAAQDMGAAGLTCKCSEMAGPRVAWGSKLDLRLWCGASKRELTAYAVSLLSESQLAHDCSW